MSSCTFSRTSPTFVRLSTRWRTQGVDELFISSGDGTVQAIQTEIAERLQPQRFMPRLALLPHGTTNMTAADLGFRNRNIKVQADFIATRESRVLASAAHFAGCQSQGRQGPRTACSSARAPSGRRPYSARRPFTASASRATSATFATLAAAVAKSLLHARRSRRSDRIDRPYEITLAANGRGHVVRPAALLLLATTLDKLILGTRPFWGGKTRTDQRVTTIPYPVPALPAGYFPLMYGGEDRTRAWGRVACPGAPSRSRPRTPFVIDGEFFEPPAGDAAASRNRHRIHLCSRLMDNQTAQIAALVAQNLDRPLSSDIRAMADHVLERHPAASAVLAYGSCLQGRQQRRIADRSLCPDRARGRCERQSPQPLPGPSRAAQCLLRRDCI